MHAMETEIIVTSLTVDELFLAIQPDERAREEAREWIRRNPVSVPDSTIDGRAKAEAAPPLRREN